MERAQAPTGPFEAITPWASKAAEQAARIAGVLTLFADPDAGSVTDDAMAEAITLAQHYLDEAVRLAEEASVSGETAAAESLRRWLFERWDDPFISPTDAMQFGPVRRDTDTNRQLLQILERHGWVGPPERADVRGKARREARRIHRGGGA